MTNIIAIQMYLYTKLLFIIVFTVPLYENVDMIDNKLPTTELEMDTYAVNCVIRQ